MAALLAGGGPASSQTGSLESVTPTGATPRLPVHIIGTGFNTTASSNLVTFSPQSGTPQTVAASAIATLDALRDRRRLTVYVPQGLPAETTALTVTNTGTGAVIAGVSLEVLHLFPPVPASASRGTAGLRVAVSASANTKFVAGRTTVSFGSGITTRSVEVQSGNSLVATIDISASTALGTRNLVIQTTGQALALLQAFSVTDAPANGTPIASANGPYQGITGQPVTFSSNGSSDPDGDTLTFAWNFGDGNTSAEANPSHTYTSPGTFDVSLSVTDGKGGSAVSNTTATIAQANRPPQISSVPNTEAVAGQAYSYAVAATDPDGDPLTFSLTTAPSGMTIGATGVVSWTPDSRQVGGHAVTVHVSDGRGGTATQSYDIVVEPPPVVLIGIDVDPASIRFSEIDGTRALTVRGLRSDGTEIDLTPGSTGTTYVTSNALVAAVSADGVITARGNGDANITVTHGTFTDTAAVVVESGVTLDALELTPAAVTLRAVGATQALTLRGTFSDGSIRDLTSAAGTTYSSSAPGVATVSGAGLVTAAANGTTEIRAVHAHLDAAASVTVAVPDGLGFIRGVVFDDSRGLPLAGAVVTLLSDGGGSLDPVPSTITDGRGMYAIQGRAGDAVLRILKQGHTAVDRIVTIESGLVVRAFDARLTPIDSRPNLLQSAFGGQARDTSGSATLTVPAGGLQADADIRLTPITAQGLAARLPLGWSLAAAAEISFVPTALAQQANLVLPNIGGVPAGTAVPVAKYDRSAHQWIAMLPSQVSQDGRSISVPVDSAGQFLALIADGGPLVPPVPVPGQAVAGVGPVALPADTSADGEVKPRSAPPGAAARAVGHVGLLAGTALPSGTHVRVHVNETFELLDTTHVVPPAFSQDILVHARPRPPSGGALGAVFAITPSRTYTIQELLRGVVKLDVAVPADEPGGTPAGPLGALVTNGDGDSLVIPPAALAHDTVIELRRSTNGPVGIPAGFDLLTSVDIDIIGPGLALPGRVSVPLPAGLSTADQTLLIHAFADPRGVRRMRIAGIGTIDGDRLAGVTSLGSTEFPGVGASGQYFFVKAQEPIGFVTGTVTGGDSTTPASPVLVTSSSAPFVDVTGAAGRYLVGARPGADAIVTAVHLLTADTATGVAHPPARDAVVVVPLTLAVTAPRVIATSPSGGALNVPLDTSITIDFSEAIAPASISDASVTLQTSGVSIAVTRVLSQDQRRLTLRPASPLAGKTLYTVLLTPAVTDLSGVPLSAFTPVSFTTLDPTKPPQPPPGQFVAELPDEDGMVLIVGSGGSAAPNSAVTGTNLRTQETTTVLALVDGSFRLRLPALVGDELTLTLRDADGRETTISIVEFTGQDGAVGLGAAGGTITGSAGRVGRVLARALTQAGTFRIGDSTQAAPVPLSLPFAYVDRFELETGSAAFNTLSSLTLTESQGRLSTTTVSEPFVASGDLTVPNDFLLNSALRFTAVAQDASGVRRSLTASTTVVSSSPSTTLAESASATDFPSVFLLAPVQALQNQLVQISAVAPAARVEIGLPAAAGGHLDYLLARVVAVSGNLMLSVADRLSPAADGQGLTTSGREFPGATLPGEYVVVGSAVALAYITGQLNGPAGIVTNPDVPFIFETRQANGRFVIPVLAGQPFSLTFLNGDGTVRGTASGSAPATGTADIGAPLAPQAGALRVTVEPVAGAVVGIESDILFRFSEPVDLPSLGAGAVSVTDTAGARVFGSLSVTPGGAEVIFRPARRWKFGTRYTYALTTAITGRSGARLQTNVTGSFVTFSPALIGAAAVGMARDVGASASVVVVGADGGAHVVDIAAPLTPQLRATMPGTAAAGGVALVQDTGLTNRNGQPLEPPLALVTRGESTAGIRLDVFDLRNPAAPVFLGHTQLSEPGTSASPSAVAADASGVAYTALGARGLAALRPGLSVPDDTANPTQALLGRYPAAGVETVTHAALLPGRVVLTGAAGLTVLDATTLAVLGQVTTDGQATGVAAISAAQMDLNGDGVLSPDTEIFDLAVVTGGSDGTVQFYGVPETGPPALLSVVRVPNAATSGVALDALERLAYVAAGIRGIAIVDLTGAPSVQPIDTDRDGVDDRLLGMVDTRGTAARIATVPGRGLGAVANGASGLAIVQLVPPRTRFISVARDPILGASGDEENLLGGGSLLTTDQGLEIVLDAAAGPRASLVLAIEDHPISGPPRLTFANGGLTAPLQDGLNSLSLIFDQSISAAEGSVTLRVKTTTGSSVASIVLSVRAPGSGELHGQMLTAAPNPLHIPAGGLFAQMSVGLVLADGRVVNVTRDPATSYLVHDSAIAAIDAQGLLTPRAGGSTSVTISHGGLLTQVSVRVDALPAPVAIETTNVRLTLTSAGQELSLPLVLRMSDGAILDFYQGAATFQSLNPAVATVDAAGRITAVGEGRTTIRATAGQVTKDFFVAVEFRTQPVLAALAVDPPGAVNAGDGIGSVRARVTGTGSLEGLSVLFEVVESALQFRASTDFEGIAVAALQGLRTPGVLTVRISVVNPATGQPLVESTAIQVLAGGRDAEPNDAISDAPLLVRDQRLQGTLGGADTRDLFKNTSATPGTLSVLLVLPVDADLTGVQVRFLDPGGTELGRHQVTGFRQRFEQVIPAGDAVVAVESLNGVAVNYQLEVGFAQAPITITSVAPLSGGPGTFVSIQGTNFHGGGGETRVLFGGVLGKTLSVTATSIEVQVPAHAVDGPVVVESGTRTATGPVFTTGVADLPLPTTKGTDPANIVFDPATGITVDVTRLALTADPLATRSEIESVVGGLGGSVIGFVAATNFYYVEFPANQTLAGLAALRRQLAGHPLISAATRDVFADAQGFRIDARDNGLVFSSTDVRTGASYEAARIFDAIEAIRSTPPFDDPVNLSSVRIGVIDTGFAPRHASEFQFQGQPLVTFYRAPANTGPFTTILGPVDTSGGHGTMVTGVISAVNDGNGTSGILNSLYAADERPKTQTFTFGIADPLSEKLSVSQALLALSTLASLGNIDAVNLSYSSVFPSASEEFDALALKYRNAFAQFQGRTVMVPAAGNHGLDARFTLPAALSTSLDYVLTAGATAVANVDGSGEGVDARAIFNNTIRRHDQGIQCRLGIVGSESSCGTTVTLAAPGEDIYTTFTAASADGYMTTQGTSFAAPILSGVVGIIQSIRGAGAAPIGASAVRSLLVASADDVSGPWDYGSMRRVNVLNAVRALLGTSDAQMIYVADQEAKPAGATTTGAIIGIDVDPLDGKPVLPANQVVIPLVFTIGSTSFTGTRPTALAIAPGGEKLYALVRSVTPDLGDGLLLINTRSNTPEDFLPLSGAPFPAVSASAGAAAPPPNVTVSSLRPGMAFSKDGRLLYVATGLDITIVNTAEEKIVRTFADLPAAYKTLASQQQSGLATRLSTLRAAAAAGVNGRPGMAINGLTLSPDGRRLYAALSTGGGGGTQPGGVLAINVDLYTDAESATPGLQSDLSAYLTLVTSTPAAMAGAGQAVGGDEPGAVGVTPNGKHVLLINGGLNFFESIPPDSLDLSKYDVLLMGAIAFLSGGVTLGDVLTSIATFSNVSDALYQELLVDMEQQAASGLTLIGAPGFTGVFNVPPTGTLQQNWFFSSDVTFGWNPSAANGGAVINQFRFRDVFAKRPFDIAVSPIGRRALVPFFQTGNVGVLDLERQAMFIAPPGSTPRPSILNLSNDLFHGLVAVTPAIRFDNHLWPRRGAFYSPGTTDRMPSPDDNLLFTWDIEYAQNGRFAAASHSGSGSPRQVTGVLGDFENDIELRTALLGLGATFNGSSVSWTEEDGTFITSGVGGSVTLKRGGGALSIINDAAINASFDAHIATTANAPDGTPRPYFSTRPIEDAVATVKQYQPAGGEKQTLHRPRGVAIQPFVAIEAPRFGDHVSLRQPLQITWRDDRVVAAGVFVRDPDQLDRFGQPTVTLASVSGFLSQQQRDDRSLSFVFGDILPQPIQGKRYRIEVRVATGQELLSRTFIDVVFDDPVRPISAQGEQLLLTPRLNFFATVPTAGSGKALTLIHKRGDGQPDANLSADTTVRWQSIDLGLAETDVPGFGSFKSFLETKLQQAGLTIPFGLASVEVTAGNLRATSSGVQAVRACLATGDICSNPIIVIAGIELDSIDLAPYSGITTTIEGAVFAANSLTERFRNLEVNPPMILAADDTAIALDKGVVLLENVTLKFLGGPATISLQDLYDGIGRVLATAGPLALKEKIAIEIGKLAVGQIAGFLPFESGNAAIANLLFGNLPGVQNLVQSGLPGVTQVTGTLDLSSIGLGAASDSVMVWVLPQVTSAAVEPVLTTVSLNTAPAARPAITTFAKVNLGQGVLYELPEQYASFAEFVDKVLPPSWKVLTTGEKIYQVNDTARISVSLAVSLEEGLSRVVLNSLVLGFTTPNLFNNYTLETPSVAALDSQGVASTGHTVRPVNKGETRVDNQVDMSLLGSIAATHGRIKVCDGQNCDEFTLDLQKQLLFMQAGDACSQQLKLLKSSPSGQVEDVTTHADTRFYSLRQLIDDPTLVISGVSVPLLNTLVQQAVQKIKARLEQAIGAPVPFAHGRVTIAANGRITVQEDGLEIIVATHQDKVSNFSVVLSGFVLDSIDLQPLSLFTPPVQSETGLRMLEQVNEALKTELEPNAPMILIDSDDDTSFAFLTSTGQVIIRDATFKVLGQSEIGVRDVLGAIEDFLSPVVRTIIRAELGPGPIADLSSKALTAALFELVELGLEETATQFLDFSVEEGPAVASVTTDIIEDVAPKGVVTAHTPGIALVKGVLKLGGDCGAGEAEDQVAVWVLPGIDTLTLKPQRSVVTRGCSTNATVKVKSVMCSAPFADAVLDLPDSIDTIGEFASRVLPSSLQPPIPGVLPVDRTFTVGDFELRVKGTIVVNFSDIRLSGLTICTTVPNGLDNATGVPGISNTYTFVNPAVGDISAVNPFSVLFREKGVVGTTDVNNHVEVFAINDNLDADGSFTVVDTPCDVMVEKVLTVPATVPPAGLSPGATVEYVVRVANLTPSAVDNVTVVDTPTFELPNGALVPGSQPVLLTCVISGGVPGAPACVIPRIEPGEIVELSVFVQVPLQGPVDGRLCNTAAVNANSSKVCHETSHSPNITVTKRLVNAAGGQPDLSIDPSGEPVLNPGTSVDYEVTITNQGSAREESITFTDETTHIRLVNGTEVRTRIHSYSEPSAFALDPGASRVILVTGVPLPLATDCRVDSRIENMARTNAAAAPVVHRMKCVPNLQIDKALTTPPIPNGQSIAGTLGPLKHVTYTVTVSNTGTGIANTVEVSDDARIVGTGIDRSLAPPGTSPGCSFVDVLPGSSETCTLRFTFGSEATGHTLVNTATITTPAGGPSAQTTHPVVPPRLEIAKELVSPSFESTAPGAPALILAGTVVSYKVTVKNIGTDAAEGATLTDLAVAGSQSTGTSVRFNAPFNIPGLEPGEIFEQQVTFQVPLSDAGRQLLNRASVDVAGVDPVEIRHDIVAASLVVEKRLVDPQGGALANLVRGSPATYELIVTNTGGAQASDVSLLDTASIDGAIIRGPTEISVGSLAPGQSRTVTLAFLVPTESDAFTVCTTCPPTFIVPPTLTNILQVQVGEVPGALTTTTNTVVNPTLQVTKTLIEPALSAGQPIPAGATVTYRIVVENTDQFIARGVQLTDRASIGSTVLFEQTFELGTLMPGDRREQLVRFRVPLGFDRRLLDNVASVNYRHPRASTSHEIAERSIELSKRLVRPAPGLLDVPGQPSLLLAGHTVQYTVTVTNRGKADSAALTVTDAPIVERRAADGSVTTIALPAQPLAVPVLKPSQSASFAVSVGVPADAHGAVLVNRLIPSDAALGVYSTEHAIVDLTGTGSLLITEMVLEPQQDWSDSSGGNGTPFDATPGTGVVDAGDIWVEILRPTTATANWKVVLTDSLGETSESVFGAAPSDPAALVKVLGGFGSLSGPVVKVEVLDDGGVVRQSIDVVALSANYPLVTGAANEAFFWSVYGLPSAAIQQFVQGTATPGLFRPF